MSTTIDFTGLSIETLEQILESTIELFLDEVGSDIRTDLESSYGQLIRILSEIETRYQGELQKTYNTLDFRSNEGVQLERMLPLLGLTKDGPIKSRIIGTATGTPATSIPNGTTHRYTPFNTDWLVVDGPYTIGGGGTVVITLEALNAGALLTAFDSNWTIVDSVPGYDSFASTSQPVIGQLKEVDADVRTRANDEAFSRGTGPLNAIRASLRKVNGVTFAEVWESRALNADETDSDGIPARSINAVVEGGTDAAVAAALQKSRGGGIRMFGKTGGTKVSEVITLSNGSTVLVEYNRVENLVMWILVEIETNSDPTEPFAPADVVTQINTLVLAQAPIMFGIGDDVRPYQLVTVIDTSGILGLDTVVVKLSLDNGVGDPFTAVKRVVTIRQRPTFDAARISTVIL